MLQLAGSRVQVQPVGGTGFVCSEVCGIFQTRIEPMSPALAGGFFTTGPSEVPLDVSFELSSLLL